MADFDLTQTDAQVQSILNDGQNMQGAGAQTTLTTESVLLKDVNGNYHKILKSSFTEAIRDTLAGLLVNNDKGTTINQIAAIASGDFGSITPANLASVLGATFNQTSATDFDAITTPGMYRNYNWNGLAHFPTGASVAGILIVSKGVDDGWVIQQYYGMDGDAWERCKLISSQGDTPWMRVDNFGCSTPADLASLLGGVETITWSSDTDISVSNNGFRNLIISGITISSISSYTLYGGGLSFDSGSFGIQIIATNHVIAIRERATAWHDWKVLWNADA